MAKKKKSQLGTRPQLGKLPPKYTFFLNPYTDARFTRCPLCDGKTQAHKHPFFIHIFPTQPFILNMTGPYCPNCDLLILHKDKLETLLVQAMEQYDPSLIGNDYLVVGTLERKGWREAQKQPGSYDVVFDNLHDFKEVVTLEPVRWGWMKDE